MMETIDIANANLRAARGLQWKILANAIGLQIGLVLLVNKADLSNNIPVWIVITLIVAIGLVGAVLLSVNIMKIIRLRTEFHELLKHKDAESKEDIEYLNALANPPPLERFSNWTYTISEFVLLLVSTVLAAFLA